MLTDLMEDCRFTDMPAGDIKALLIKLDRRVSKRVLMTYPSDPDTEATASLPIKVEEEKMCLTLAHNLKCAISLKKTSAEVIRLLRQYDEEMPKEFGMGASCVYRETFERRFKEVVAACIGGERADPVFVVALGMLTNTDADLLEAIGFQSTVSPDDVKIDLGFVDEPHRAEVVLSSLKHLVKAVLAINDDSEAIFVVQASCQSVKAAIENVLLSNSDISIAFSECPIPLEKDDERRVTVSIIFFKRDGTLGKSNRHIRV